VIRDRNLPIAKIIPLNNADVSEEELALAASGELLLPSERFNERAFWLIGATHPMSAATAEALSSALSEDREERPEPTPSANTCAGCMVGYRNRSDQRTLQAPGAIP
jgi:hypothetical protein